MPCDAGVCLGHMARQLACSRCLLPVLRCNLRRRFNGIYKADFVLYPLPRVPKGGAVSVDIAFSQFPWFIDLSKEVIENSFFSVSSFPDFAFLINLARTLSKNGRAIALIHDSLFRLNKFKKDRQNLIESGFIESLVS